MLQLISSSVSFLISLYYVTLAFGINIGFAIPFPQFLPVILVICTGHALYWAIRELVTATSG